MRVRKLMIQRMINMKQGKLESKRRLMDEAIIAAQEKDALANPLDIESEEVQNAGESSGEEDSGEINWEGSRKVLVKGESKVSSTSKKRSKTWMETNEEGIA